MPEYISQEMSEVFREPPVTCMTTGPIFKKMKVLKKFKKKMGFSTSGRRQHEAPMAFHHVHGDNIRLSRNRKVARRSDSFCKGVVFSNRPLKLGERVYVRLVEISTTWSGVIRFGFTSQDPQGLQNALPKYVCPDLTNKPGYWAKALSERYARRGIIMSYYVTSSGDVHFAIDGEEKGIFFSGVETRSPLWSVIDVYGNCTAIEYLDPPSRANNRLNVVNNLLTEQSLSENGTLARLTQSSRPATSRPPPPLPLCNQDELVSQISQLSLSSSVGIPQHFPSTGISSFPFHRVKGRHIELNHDRTIATRALAEYSHGYVFSPRPLIPGEHFIIQVQETMPSYVGALSFGLTSANPAGLDAGDLPEDCDLLLDRPEYWVVSKDVASSPGVHTEIAFGLSIKGEVLMSSRGRRQPRVVMHVDISQPLWAFFDIFGNTRKIKILGILPPSTPMCFSVPIPLRIENVRIESTVARSSVLPQLPRLQCSQAADRQSPSMEEIFHECTVCYEASVDSVLYSCGHMCMCYECALQQWKGRGGGHCPMCRAVIRDVIRTYRS